MKILALDSSGLVASVAILEKNTESGSALILAKCSTDYKKTHSQTLLPMIDHVCRQTDTKAQDFDAVAIASGPGSFTGLRIGSATAKAIAMAADVPIVEVPTLKGLAYNFWGDKRLICPMMDARRDQVYTGVYGFEDGRLTVIRDQAAVALEEIIGSVNSLGKEVVFLGDGADAYRKRIEETVTCAHSFAPAHLNRQDAASVAILALEMYERGETVNADDHSPEYLRVSQAEREGAKSFDLTT